MSELLLTNIGMLATPTGSSARSGAEQGQIQILRNAWVLISQGQIAQVGSIFVSTAMISSVLVP